MERFAASGLVYHELSVQLDGFRGMEQACLLGSHVAFSVVVLNSRYSS